jgi:hypothetical protein
LNEVPPTFCLATKSDTRLFKQPSKAAHKFGSAPGNINKNLSPDPTAGIALAIKVLSSVARVVSRQPSSQFRDHPISAKRPETSLPGTQ